MRREISQAGVRAVMLAAQGLCEEPSPATKADVLRAIRRMHALQIDTIHVVARSPYLVLWTRIGEYETRWLDELLAEGGLFECWAHAACFVPIEDYPLYRGLTLAGGRWRGRAQAWLDAHAEAGNAMLQHVRDNGAVRSADFERTDGQKGGWWNWKTEKLALECLFDTGELMIARRENFQRVYDLRERVLPDWDDARLPPIEEVHRQLALNSALALGLAKADWISEYLRLSKTKAKAALKSLTGEGLLRTIDVEGWSAPAYYHPANEDLVAAAADGVLPQSRTTVLSPFDPILWDRPRAQAHELFGFEYQIEAYTPEAKRKYGYFALPILYKNTLIGRLDPKAFRKEGVFEVKALHLEDGVEVSEELVLELGAALKACAAWHKTPEVLVRQASVAGLARRLSD